MNRKKCILSLLSLLFIGICPLTWGKKTSVTWDDLNAYAGFEQLDNDEKIAMHEYVNRISPLSFACPVNWHSLAYVTAMASSLREMKYYLRELIHGPKKGNLPLETWLNIQENERRMAEYKKEQHISNREETSNGFDNFNAFIEALNYSIEEPSDESEELIATLSNQIDDLCRFLKEEGSALKEIPSFGGQWMDFDFQKVEPVIETLTKLIRAGYVSELPGEGFRCGNFFLRVYNSGKAMRILYYTIEGEWDLFHGVDFH